MKIFAARCAEGLVYGIGVSEDAARAEAEREIVAHGLDRDAGALDVIQITPKGRDFIRDGGTYLKPEHILG